MKWGKVRLFLVTTHVTPTEVGVQNSDFLDSGFRPLSNELGSGTSSPMLGRRNDEPEQLLLLNEPLDFSKAADNDGAVGIAGAGQKNVEVFLAENIGQNFRRRRGKINLNPRHIGDVQGLKLKRRAVCFRLGYDRPAKFVESRYIIGKRIWQNLKSNDSQLSIKASV